MAEVKNVIGVLFVLSIVFALIRPTLSYIEKPGPRYPQTKGEVWPKPQHQIKLAARLKINPISFDIKVVGTKSSLIDRAIERSRHNIYQLKFEPDISHRKSFRKKTKIEKRTFYSTKDDVEFKTLIINMTGPKETWPSLGMDESYRLDIGDNGNLTAISVWGVIRGLETFSQLVYRDSPLNLDLFINQTYIYDYPRFSHRGLLLDTSRHYVSFHKMINILNAMAYNKLNVLHWHIVDDQSFPYESIKFPELSKQGAYSSWHTYMSFDIKEIINYARYHGIRVIPEFDTPGHTRSWGVAYPKLLTECYTNGVPNGDLGPMNPANEELYPFMKDLLEEIEERFPDDFVHLGGDEVGFDCWESNPNITAFMTMNNITSYNKLEEFYIQKIININHNLNASSYCMARSIFQWCKFTSRLLLFKLGLELDNYCCLRIFPRASAVAERLWSDENVNNYTEARYRLEEHYCRMNKRGVYAQPPNGPGFCF